MTSGVKSLQHANIRLVHVEELEQYTAYLFTSSGDFLFYFHPQKKDFIFYFYIWRTYGSAQVFFLFFQVNVHFSFWYYFSHLKKEI